MKKSLQIIWIVCLEVLLLHPHSRENGSIRHDDRRYPGKVDEVSKAKRDVRPPGGLKNFPEFFFEKIWQLKKSPYLCS
ncbi:hypothetical protein, partial [uncultured Parabacteroides sp.]